MSLTVFGWFFVICSIPILLHFLMGTRGLRREQPDVENCKASLEEIGVRFKNGELTETEADAARLALLSRLPSRRWEFGKFTPSRLQKLLVASAIFLLVSGIGAAVSYDKSAPDTIGSQETISFAEPDGEMLTRLTDYVRSIGSEQLSPIAATGELLPDVNAMIARLAARLETAPKDIEGWRMLGWSYYHTERYEQAATAFGRALELDPNSAKLKLSYEEAKAAGDISKATAPMQTGSLNEAAGAGNMPAPDAMPPGNQDAAIRSMVDGLAKRLEKSPRDADGWINLMRSRVVLGEAEKASTALRKARQAFSDDEAASGRINSAAVELGLTLE